MRSKLSLPLPDSGPGDTPRAAPRLGKQGKSLPGRNVSSGDTMSLGIDPPVTADALPERMARLEERVTALDRVYREKVEQIEAVVEGLREEVRGLRGWVQGTAVVLALQVLGLILYALASRAGG